MAVNYSGRQFSVTIGVQDQSAQAIGSSTVTNIANLNMRLSPPVSDISWDGGMQVSEVRRTGRRMMEAGDRVQQYGSGEWTWDFDYLVENEAVSQVLFKNIANGQACTSATTIDQTTMAAPDLSHDKGGTTDYLTNIIINHPSANFDRVMHNAVLQSLTWSMDADVDGGRMHMAGQFMSGYKPVIAADSTSPATTAADKAYNIFSDCTTTTIGGDAVVMKAWEITLENPASRVSYQGTSGETDGYVRGGNVNLTGSVTVKVDTVTAALAADWHGNAPQAIVIGNGGICNFSIPAAQLSGYNADWADEGAFVEIPFVGTTGAAGVSELAVIHVS